MEDLARRFAAAMTPERAAELAADLGLRVDVLARLPLLGYSPTGFHKDRGSEPCFTFPESNSDGKITGINCRYKDGHKAAIVGRPFVGVGAN